MDTVSRRLILHYLAAIGMTANGLMAMPSNDAPNRLERLRFTRNDWVPNNPQRPVLLYRAALAGKGLPSPDETRRLFDEHGWPVQWVAGIYDYHHYHSTAHEVLGILGGEARVMLGGPGGKEIAVHAGDVLVLPTGTGHCNIGSSDDFHVAGGYPRGQQWDLCRGAATPTQQHAIAHVPYPPSDPVHG